MKVTLRYKSLLHKERAHRYLARKLDFPDYYGANLDALFDCLSELHDHTIELLGAEELRNSDGYGARILKVLEEAAESNPGLTLLLR